MSTHDQQTKIQGSTGSVASVTPRGSKGAVSVEIVDGNGNQLTAFSNVFAIGASDSVVCTYDSSGNMLTAIFKLNAVVLNTITMTYDSSGNMLTAVKT